MDQAQTILLIAPRWGGTLDDDFYPWLRSAIAERIPSVIYAGLPMPNPEEPIIPDWLAHIDSTLADLSIHPEARLLMVGHSVGCQAIVRYLASTNRPLPPPHLLLVAAWWSVDNPWPPIIPWQENNFDLAAVKARAASINVVLSDNDPFTSDFRTNQELWQERLSAEVKVHENMEHFNGPRYPFILEQALELLGAKPSSSRLTKSKTVRNNTDD